MEIPPPGADKICSVFRHWQILLQCWRLTQSGADDCILAFMSKIAHEQACACFSDKHKCSSFFLSYSWEMQLVSAWDAGRLRNFPRAFLSAVCSSKRWQAKITWPWWGNHQSTAISGLPWISVCLLKPKGKLNWSYSTSSCWPNLVLKPWNKVVCKETPKLKLQWSNDFEGIGRVIILKALWRQCPRQLASLHMAALNGAPTWNLEVRLIFDLHLLSAFQLVILKLGLATVPLSCVRARSSWDSEACTDHLRGVISASECSNIFSPLNCQLCGTVLRSESIALEKI